jgi:mono/diheme cytochrome c family protein
MRRRAVIGALGLGLAIASLLVAAGCGPPMRGEEQAAQAPAAAAAAWKMPIPDQDYNVREGDALFHYYCSTCHGNEGQGDGLNAYNLDPKPRDLSAPDFQKKRTDDDLAGVIRSGGGVAGLSTGMPPWGRTLGERKVRNIVSFIRTLKPPAP